MARYEISNEVRPLDRLITRLCLLMRLVKIADRIQRPAAFHHPRLLSGHRRQETGKDKRQQNASFMEMTAEWSTYHAETNRQVGLVRRFRWNSTWLTAQNRDSRQTDSSFAVTYL